MCRALEELIPSHLVEVFEGFELPISWQDVLFLQMAQTVFSSFPRRSSGLLDCLFYICTETWMVVMYFEHPDQILCPRAVLASTKFKLQPDDSSPQFAMD